MPALVLLTEQLLAPVPGGTGRYTAELVTALAATAPPGWQLTGVTARHRGAPPTELPHRSLPLPRKGVTLAWQAGVPLWPGGDVLHAPTPLAPPRSRRGAALVVTVHDAVPFTHPETLTSRGAAWHRAMITRAVRTASAVVVPTEAVAAELAEHAPGPAPLHVIGHGVAPVLRQDPDPAVVERITRRLPPRYLLAVGTIEPRKGLDVLAAALREPGAPDLPLVLAGQPGWGSVDLGPRPPLVLGRLTDAELAVVLRGAAVLVAPSVAEGFGLPLLEAMALGVPVVHSDAPALVEVAGGTGVTARRGDPASFAEAVRTVLDQPERTARRVAAARLRAQEYRWDRAATRLWALYREVHRGTTRAGR